jgi:RHH-type proline utilization regulon transcriptional repressor/proline dehydrogenase/delta 1-pyrroline-5-carboxylate dehydrogenase
VRIPDAATADKLIRDKLSQGDWERHVGRSRSLLGERRDLGNDAHRQAREPRPGKARNAGEWFAKLASRAGEPVVRLALRQGMKLMAEQFVMGPHDRRAPRAQPRVRERRLSPFLRHAGRGGLHRGGRRALLRFRTRRRSTRSRTSPLSTAPAIPVFGAPGISIKLSALHPRYEFAQRARVLAELTPRIEALAARARRGDIGVTLDAEEADRLGPSLEVFERAFLSRALSGLGRIRARGAGVPEARAFVLDWLRDLARRGGRRMMTRLVKGAYWDTEVKRAQMLGLSGYRCTRASATPTFPTSRAPRACSRRPKPSIRSSRPTTRTPSATILERAREGQPFEFQRLHGMGEDLYGQLVAEGRPLPRVRAGRQPRGPAPLSRPAPSSRTARTLPS